MRPIQLTRVLHVPNLRNNLLSVLFLTRQRGFIVKITGNAMYFNLNGETLFTATIDDNNTAYLDGTTRPVHTVFASSTLPLDISLWHRRLGHCNLDSIRHMVSKELVTGLKIDSSQSPDPICEPCLAGKMHASPFPSSSTRASKPLELVHSDLHGPLPRSHSGHKYWIVFVDDYTRMRVAYCMHNKSDAFARFKDFKAYAEKQLGTSTKPLRDEKGEEYS